MEIIMDTATVSTKYQVVIPQKIRKGLNILPGQKVRFVLYKNSIEIIPIVNIKNLWGIFKGIDTNIERDEEDRI
jgi:AbrB family looped-hinge helix DNA binding protein